MSAFDPMGYLMDCESLHLYFDGELDTVAALAFEKHLETCAQCRAELAEFREIRRHLQSELTRMPASDGLRQKIRGDLAQAADEDAPPVRRRSTAWQKFAIAASIVAIVSSGTTHYLEQPNEEALWTQGIVKAHERAMLADHRIDVASSNRHTVKPGSAAGRPWRLWWSISAMPASRSSAADWTCR